MVKTLRAVTVFLLASPLLIQCVPAQDVNSLDLRVRNLDNQVFQLGKAVNQMGGGAGTDNPLEQIQTKQAEMADNIDRLNSEVMQMKGQLEEASHLAKTSPADTDLQKKVDYLTQQVAVLSDQVNQNTSALKTGQPVIAASPGTSVKALERGSDDTAGESVAKEPPTSMQSPEDKQKPQEETEAASSNDPGKAIYDQGLELFRASKFNEAYRTFSDYISKYPKGKMAPNARFWLGDCYYNQQEYELAILEYQKVIADYPSDGKAPAALLKQGLAFEKLKDNETAKIVYNKLLKEYPKSDQVETAKKRLDSFK